MHHHPHHPHPHLLLRSLLSSQFGTKSKTTDLTNFFLQLKKPPNSLLPFSGFVLNEKLQRNALQFAIFYKYTYKAKSCFFEISFCVRPEAFLTVFDYNWAQTLQVRWVNCVQTGSFMLFNQTKTIWHLLILLH